MAIVRRVLDLSHHNTVSNLQTVKNAGIWGIIHKATESTGYTDPNYAGRKKGFLEIGLLWGAYHFFHPGNVKAQVDYFLRIAGIDDHTLYALDWEQSSSGTANETQAVQFLQYLEQATGRKGVVYSGNVAKEQIHGVNEYLGSHRLWLAQYSNTCQTQESWHGNVWLWQYSDGQHGPQPHGCPGVTGDVDTNSWTGSQEELRTEWSGYEEVPVIPEPEPPEAEVAKVYLSVSVTGNAQVYVNGQPISGAEPPEEQIPSNQTSIVATVFGGKTDPQQSAYDGHLISDTELGVALPDRFEGTRPKVRVFKGELSVLCDIVDVGPWFTNNPYWETGQRPQAEGDASTNGAGIDLTPGAARAIGLDGKGKVDWIFV